MKKLYKAAKHYSRVDHFLNESLPDVSRSKIEKLIKENHVKLNDKILRKKNKEIVPGDRVEVEFIERARARSRWGTLNDHRELRKYSQDNKMFIDSTGQEVKIYRPSMELSKLFEDEHLLIIDKPPGISVHPGAGEQEETILDIFSFYYPQIKEIRDTDRPGIVHRLDKDTSGVLVLAKDWKTMKKMQRQFKRREVQKTYLALISGSMRHRHGTIDEPIKRSRRQRKKFIVAKGEDIETARNAVTDFSVIWEFPGFSFVRLSPHTGRTHQLRVHLSHYGCPILGDKIYGRRESFARLGLHAYSIEFCHPITGHHIISCSPLPLIFRDFLKKSITKL